MRSVFGGIVLPLFFTCLTSAHGGQNSKQGATAQEECSIDYLQGCKSCKQLARITSQSEPDNGDYYRGAQWNGLYTAYVHNCLGVAETLLKRGANPNWGGWQGSMVLSIVDKWPHENQNINQKWAGLFLRYGARAGKKIPDQNKTPEMMVKEGDFEPDYPELWKKFLN
jgi:hypothetical protein